MTSLSRLLAALLAVGSSSAFADDAEFAPKIYATRADGGQAWELATLKDYSDACSPALSPDGTRVALDGWQEGQRTTEAHIVLVNLNDGAVEDLGRGAMPSWSADGTWLAYSTYDPNHGVYVCQAQGGFEELIEAGGWGIQWSPDGKRLAYMRGSNLIVYDPVTKTKHAVFGEHEELPYWEVYRNWDWSPDSRQICFKGRRRPLAARARSVDEVAIVNVDGDPHLRICCDADDVADDVAWHPDGSRIVIAKAGQLYEINPGANDPPRLVPGLPAGRTICGMCWSRDGEILIFSSCRRHVPAGMRIEFIEVRDTF